MGAGENARMGKLTEQIRADLTASMKARTAERTSTLRMLQSAFKYEQIEAGHVGQIEIDDQEIRACRCMQRDRLRAIVRNDHRETPRLEGRRDHLSELDVVLDHENASRRLVDVGCQCGIASVVVIAACRGGLD